MASGDNLRDLIDLARREISSVPPEAWDQLLALASVHFGTRELYVNAPQRKRARLEVLSQLESDLDSATLAVKLGVGVRRAQQYKRLR